MRVLFLVVASVEFSHVVDVVSLPGLSLLA